VFTIIAERINMTRSRIREEVWNRNADTIAAQVQQQEDAGATHIDINAGGDPAKEVEDMRWLVEVVAQATDLPLVLDSSSPEAIQAGLEVCKRPGTIVNSITGERERIDGILPLVKEYGTGVICLTMDDAGMPEDLDGRLRITRDLAALLAEQGVGLDRAYFDHLIRVKPRSSSMRSARRKRSSPRRTSPWGSATSPSACPPAPTSTAPSSPCSSPPAATAPSSTPASPG